MLNRSKICKKNGGLSSQFWGQVVFRLFTAVVTLSHRTSIDKGDAFNTHHEIQFHARFWLYTVTESLVPFLAAYTTSSRVAERLKAVAHG